MSAEADMRRWWGAAWDRWDEMRRTVGFWTPLPLPPWAAPGLAIGALLALIASAAIALLSLGVLLTALLIAHLLLERVFGVSIALALPR